MDSSTKSTRQWTEFQINVPYGHIAGKWWGPHYVRPILVLHGWQDNAGSFDPLIAMLPTHLSYLAIDFPGHGLSSHIPEGLMIHANDFVMTILRIVKQMKWSKVSILGHSMGGVMGLWFAVTFPNRVDSLIMIDALKPPQFDKDIFWDELGNKIKKLKDIGNRPKTDNEPPSYTFDECIKRLSNSGSIDQNKCKYVVCRNVKESRKQPGRYYFARDERLKFMETSIWPQELYVVLASQVKIPHLFIKALDGPLNELTETFNETINILKKNPLFQYEEVPGNHHVHLNQPENVCDIIGAFLTKYSDDLCKKSNL